MDGARNLGSVLVSRLCGERRARFAALICLFMLVGACQGGPRAGSRPAGTASANPAIWLAKSGPRVVHLPDRAGDVLDHTGHAAPDQGAVDLVDVTVTADESGLTVVFTTQGNIPKSSGPGVYDGKHDALRWEAAFSFTGELDDERRYFQLRVNLVGTEWQAQIAIFVGSTPGNFKLTSTPRHDKNQVIISVPWSEPVTATRVNGDVVTLPRLPKRVFVSAGTQWDFFSPPGDLSFSAGGDKAPDEDRRVEMSF